MSCCVCDKESKGLYLGELCCCEDNCMEVLEENLEGGSADIYYE